MAVAAMRSAMQRLLFLPLFRHYIRVSSTGLPHLEKTPPPVIFAANHTSHLDTVALLATLPADWRARVAPAARQQHFFPSGPAPDLARRIELKAQYWLACSLFNAYPLSQDLGHIRDTLRYTGELVESGLCPLVYPEGRLSPNGNLQPFQSGIGLMSVRLEVPVIPTCIKGLFDVMSAHDPWPRRGSVQVRFGPPIHPRADEDYVRLAERVEASIQAMATEMQD